MKMSVNATTSAYELQARKFKMLHLYKQLLNWWESTIKIRSGYRKIWDKKILLIIAFTVVNDRWPLLGPSLEC